MNKRRAKEPSAYFAAQEKYWNL